LNKYFFRPKHSATTEEETDFLSPSIGFVIGNFFSDFPTKINIKHGFLVSSSNL